jgi:hypothetical protein
MDKQQEPGTVRVTMSFGELARGAREVVSEAVKGFSRRIGQEGRGRQGSGAPIEQAKAEALRRARRREAKAAEGGEKGDASSSSERLREWRREFFRHARRFGWASELLQSEDWRKAGRALAEERLRDSAIHLAQAGLRVGSQGLGSVIGGMLGAETGPGAAVAAWAGSTFVGALGARAAGALSVHLSPEGRKSSGRGKERAG